MVHRLRELFVGLLFLFLTIHPVSAQGEWIARLSAPDTSRFPTIQAYLDLHDASGGFVHDLQPTQITIVESGNRQPITEVEEIRPGLQVVVALNPGLAFGIRNSQAVSRYDLIRESLRSWANSRLGTSTDDWSLLVGKVGEISHTSDPAIFIDGLDTIQDDPRLAQPSIDILARAVNLASDPTPRPGMGKSVLFITSSIEGDLEQAIKDISDQARQHEITISIWQVASRGAMITRSAQQLTALAISTGGQVFTFSGEEELPDPDRFLDAMRYIYRISYNSQVGLSGAHEFSAEIQIEGDLIQSNSLNFQIDLLPPVPALVSPPISVERKLTAPLKNEPDLAIAESLETEDPLSPREIFLQVVFDFPDGRKRELVSSALLVNGIVVAQNLEPPFDQFTWNLENFRNDEDVLIQVQSTDVLGLTGTSIELPVEITVTRPETDPWFVVRKNLVTISILLVLIAGGLLFLVLVVGGKLRPATQITSDRSSLMRKPRKLLPEVHTSLPHKHSGWVSRLQRPLPSLVLDARAYISKISEAGGHDATSPVPITDEETLIGSDPIQANILIEDSCIEPVHARLKCEPNGEFLLFDLDSIAGTWINYTPVSKDGTRLSPNDVIHFGRIGYQFSLHERPSASETAVELEFSKQEGLAHDPNEDIEEKAQ